MQFCASKSPALNSNPVFSFKMSAVAVKGCIFVLYQQALKDLINCTKQ